MTKYIKPFIFLIIIILAMFSYSFFSGNTGNARVKKYININNLSKNFMDKYFEETKELTNDDLKYSLIVTSLSKIDNNYGAKNVIEGPNHQYLFSYSSKEEMKKSQKLLENDKKIDHVTKNIDLELYDTNYNSWGITKSGIDKALEYIGSSNPNKVTVAVLDSGVNMELFNAYYNGRIKETINLYDNEEIYDECGHGTHVTGTLAEATPSNVDIIPFKLGEEHMNLYLIILAFNYVVYYDKADVINLSLGTESDVYDLYVAIAAANDAGIISVAAAGNDGLEVNSYPAAFDNTISVSAVDSSLNHSSFSNYSDTVTFSAPGEAVKSINGFKSGTSMATPHVTSAVALLKLIKPDLTLEEAIRILRKHVLDLGESGYDKYYGYGFLDISAFSSIANELNNTSYVSIDGNENVTITNNYGNNTNLLDLEFTFEDGNGDSFTKKLSELNGVEIEDYDPFSCSNQSVKIKYKGLTKTINVKNNVCEINVYETSSLGNNKISIDRVLVDNIPRYIEIPEEIDGKKVTTLGDSLFEEKTIEEILLPSTLETIGDSAFASSNIKNVSGGAEALNIGAHAFDKASYLVNFEPAIKSLGEYAFNEDSRLRNVTFSKDLHEIPTFAFYECVLINEIDLTYITSIDYLAYTNVKVDSLFIPKTLTNIDEMALISFNSLENITVEEGNPVYDSRENSNNLILTSENKVILGSSNSVIPDSITSIGDYAFFSNSKLSYLNTNKVTSIGEMAFAACSKLALVELSPNLTTVDSNLFSGSSRAIALAHNYNLLGIFNKDDQASPYAFLVTVPKEIVVVGASDRYTAFDTVGNITLNLTYDGYTKDDDQSIFSESITSGYVVNYQNGNNSFRYGDKNYTISFVNQYNKEITKDMSVTVDKKDPNYVYTSSDNIVRKDGLAHGINLNVTSPSNAKVAYMDQNGNYTLNTMPTYVDAGSYTINYKIYIDNNYTEIYGSQRVIISENEINYSKDYEGIYDGDNHTFNLDVRLDNYTIRYSLDNSNFNLTKIPSFSDIGEHVVYYRITSSTYGEIDGSNKVKIYGIKDISSDAVVNNNIIAFKKNSLNALIKTFNIYAEDAVYKHYDKNNVLINTDKIATGEKIIISILDRDVYSYNISLVGDVSGDGVIDSMDLLRVRQHLIGSRVASGSYYIAGDINNDNKVDSFDLLRIRQHLIGTKLIS